MRRLIRRLQRTSLAEVRFRSSELIHTGREMIGVGSGRERWNRTRLRSKLRVTSADLGRADRALAAGNWARAEEALRSHFLHRPQRFLIAPPDRPEVARIIRERFPSSTEDAVRRANELLAGRYDLLGYRALSFATSSSPIDWHFDPVHERRAPPGFWSRVPYLDPRSGDHKVIWELNRHQHWLALGRAAWLTDDGRYAARFARELSSWLRANPPLLGINWSSMLELAFRTISWAWALHLFAEFEGDSSEPAFVDLLLALDRQLDHVERHLSTYFSPNTHLLGEGLALYTAGRSLPEMASSARWEHAGREILLRETRAQVHDDGGHAELSTHYHRYALDFYLLALILARRTHDPAADVFAEVVSRLATFCRSVADDRGLLATIGDDDGGMLFPICGREPFDAADSLALAAAVLDRPELAVGDLPEEAIWMLGADYPPGWKGRANESAIQTSRLFPETGYAVLRDARAHAIVDVGPHGFMNGGHAHADALSIVLSVGGRPLLIDPGTSTYTMDRERRDRFRSTAMHNTLAIDGRAQSLPDGPFHWATKAQARVDFWRAGGDADYIEASHDGYLPLIHRRAVLRASGSLLLVVDHVLGTGRHTADVHWHLSPAWSLTSDSTSPAALTHRDGAHAGLASTAPYRREFYADAEGLGWCAPVYGQLEPSLTLRVSTTSAAPFSVISALAYGEAALGLMVRDVEVTTAESDWHCAGASVTTDDSVALVLFATPLSQRRVQARKPSSIRTSAGQFSTDARAAVLQFSKEGDPERLIAMDCSVAEWTGNEPFRVAPHPGEQDLHLDGNALRRLSHVSAARPGR